MTAEWVMVIITGIYVIATIFICLANIKAANASKEQLREILHTADWYIFGFFLFPHGKCNTRDAFAFRLISSTPAVQERPAYHELSPLFPPPCFVPSPQ